MLSKKVSTGEGGLAKELLPTYARRGLTHPISRYELPMESMEPDDAYRLIYDELALDGNPELNQATLSPPGWTRKPTA